MQLRDTLSFPFRFYHRYVLDSRAIMRQKEEEEEEEENNSLTEQNNFDGSYSHSPIILQTKLPFSLSRQKLFMAQPTLNY